MSLWYRIGDLLGLVDDAELEDELAYKSSGARVEQTSTSAPRIEAGVLHAVASRSVTVRPIPAKPQSIAPQNKDDLRRAIDALRAGQSVILDVSHVPAALRHRMLDYISGGCSAVSARMERIAVNVFLLDRSNSVRE